MTKKTKASETALRARCGNAAGRDARRETIAVLRSKRGISIEDAIAGVRKALGAEVVRSYLYNGALLYSKPLPDYTTRLRAAELALNLYDAFPSKRHELSAPDGPIIIRVVDEGVP